MENSDVDLLSKIEALKNEIRNMEISNTLYKHDITTRQSNAKEKSEELQNIYWKIKRAEFVAYCENMKHEKYCKKMQETETKLSQETFLSESLAKYRISCNSLEIRKKDLEHKKQTLMLKIEELNLNTSNMNHQHADLEQSILILKNRNTALMRKLQKQNQEIEYLERNLRQKITNLESIKRQPY